MIVQVDMNVRDGSRCGCRDGLTGMRWAGIHPAVTGAVPAFFPTACTLRAVPAVAQSLCSFLPRVHFPTLPTPVYSTWSCV